MEDLKDDDEMPQSVDWFEIATPFDELIITFWNLLEREFPLKYRNVDSAFLLFMTRFRLAVNTYQAIMFLVSDIPHDPHRRKTFKLAVSPLVRTLFEELIVVAFLVHDVPKYTLTLFKTTYKEIKRELEHIKKYHDNDSRWDAYTKRLEKRLEDLEIMYNLTPDEASKIKRYPSPGEIKKIIEDDFPNSPFLQFYEFINSWMYRKLSLSSHMDIQTLTRRGLHISKPLARKILGDDHEDFLKHKLETQAHENMYMTVTILMAIMTEIDSDFKFDPRFRVKPRLKELWEKLIVYSDIAKDFYEYRYKAISKET